MRRDLGDRLVAYRNAAGVTQRIIGKAIGRTCALVSQVEHGKRGLTAEQWTVVDDLCGAEGDLVAVHRVLEPAERDHRARVRVHRAAAQRVTARAAVDTLRASPTPLGVAGRAACPGLAVVGELAEELVQVLTRLVRSVGRRDAMRVTLLAVATFGLPGADPDEGARTAQALHSPRRVDPQVVRNLAGTLVHCKRQEDVLGPAAVLPTVVAQHGVVRHLLEGGCPERLTRPLLALASDMATAIGGYLVDLGDLDGAARYFRAARKAGHDAHNPAYAAYAASHLSLVARLSGEAHTAMDMAVVARDLAARTDDPRLKAFAEQTVAAAYALDGNHGRCLAAYSRAKTLIAGDTGGSAPGSPAYFVHDATLDTHLSGFLVMLNRPRDAVEAATNALVRTDWRRAFVQVRLGAALVLAREVGEAARVLGDAAGLAGVSPRLTAELRAARAGMAPWQGTPAVKTLDEQLAASDVGLD